MGRSIREKHPSTFFQVSNLLLAEIRTSYFCANFTFSNFGFNVSLVTCYKNSAESEKLFCRIVFLLKENKPEHEKQSLKYFVVLHFLL